MALTFKNVKVSDLTAEPGISRLYKKSDGGWAPVLKGPNKIVVGLAHNADRIGVERTVRAASVRALAGIVVFE